MARAVKIEWSEDALHDLERFAAFLQEHHPDLAPAAARAIIDRAQVLSEFPRLGRAIVGREEYRQLVLQVLNTPLRVLVPLRRRPARDPPRLSRPREARLTPHRRGLLDNIFSSTNGRQS